MASLEKQRVQSDVLAPASGSLTTVSIQDASATEWLRVEIGLQCAEANSPIVAPLSGVLEFASPNQLLLHVTEHITAQLLLPALPQGGFVAQVSSGEAVVAGQRLGVLQGAASRIKLAVQAEQGLTSFVAKPGCALLSGECLLRFEVLPGQLSNFLRIPNAVGLHARPAANLAAAAKAWTADITLLKGVVRANAKSLIAIMGLGARQGDQVRLHALGPDASAAIAALSRLIAGGCEEMLVAPTPISREQSEPSQQEPRVSSPLLQGVPAAPGLALGQVYHLRQDDISVEQQGASSLIEHMRLEHALHEGIQQLEALKGKVMDRHDAGIFAAHQELLADPSLIELAQSGIHQGESAAYAWRAAYTQLAGRFAALPDELLAARASDIRDVGRRVLLILVGAQEAAFVVPPGSIILAEDLTPSITARLDRSQVVGLCTTQGGATSHAAILARSLGLPAICGMDERILGLADGTRILLDGNRGTVQINPSAAEQLAFQDQQQTQQQQQAQDLDASKLPAVTADGYPVEVVANIGGLAEAQQAMQLGGDGVGLLRSEFLFLNRMQAPSEEEQSQIYLEIAQVLGPLRPLVVRTLDVGGDKPLQYLPMPEEENPFLGVRGLRLSMAEPNLFRVQLRAILRVAAQSRLRVMFPMVTSLEEVRWAKKIVHEERDALGCVDPVQIGIMVEVPSVALLAEQFAAEVDFFSIGTNDLTQYTLAMDRGHPRLAKEADALHPAVLRLIAMAVKGAHQQGKWVGVCGSMASDPLAIPVLVGLQVDELSVSVPAIPAVKAQIRRLSFVQCEQLAQEVLNMPSLTKVRQHLGKF